MILFATDCSSRDRPSFQLACLFARAWQAKLLIAHADNSQTNPPQVELPGEDIRHQLHEFVPADLEINYDHILRQGDPADVIFELEKEHNVDLIVLGTHGRKGIERMIWGSVAERVIRNAECAVLTLNPHIQESTEMLLEETNRILVPIDFSVHSYAALDFASALAATTNATITILYVDEAVAVGKDSSTPLNQEEHRDQTWARLVQVNPTRPAIEHDHKILFGSARDQIAEFANSRHFDLIVLGTHGRTGVRRVLMGSVAEHVLRNIECPVITVKPGDKKHTFD